MEFEPSGMAMGSYVGHSLRMWVIASVCGSSPPYLTEAYVVGILWVKVRVRVRVKVRVGVNNINSIRYLKDRH